MGRTATRKKPCRICRRWFLPDVRLKDRQKTCGRTECKRQWHNKKCAQWYRANIDYFKANYLQKKIEAVEGDEPLPTDTPKPDPMKVTRSRMKSGHEDLQATMVYLRLDLNHRRKVQKRFVEFNRAVIMDRPEIEALINIKNEDDVMAWLDSL